MFSDLSHVKMNGTKSMIGHCLGAAGGMEAIATIQAIRTGWVHPTINHVRARAGGGGAAAPRRAGTPQVPLPALPRLPCCFLGLPAPNPTSTSISAAPPFCLQENPIEEVDGINVVPNTKQQHDITVGISNSFGFGGHNSVVAFAPFKA